MLNKFKFFMITMAVLLALPVMAGAYTISPHLSPSDAGTISPGQVTGLDDAATQDFVITPNAGYEVSRIALNGVTIFSGVTNTGGFTDLGDGSYQVTAWKMSANTVMSVAFDVPAAEIFQITRTAAAGGAISAVPYLSETELQQVALGSNLTFAIKPNNGYELATFTVDGVDALGDLVGGQYTLSNITANHTLAATFNKLAAAVAVNAGPDIILPAVGELGALKATANLNVGEYTCAWTDDAADATLVIADAAACETTVTTGTADAASVITLTVTDLNSGLTYSDSLTVSAKSVDTAEAQLCASCHEIRNPELYVAGEIQAPHTGAVALTQGMYTAGASCTDCHTSDHSAGEFTIYQQYAQSGHGDTHGEAWAHYDFSASNRASCQPCHSSTGFVNALEGNAPAAVSELGEVLNCVGCHENAGTGVLRATDGVQTITYGASSYTYPELGASDLCVRCHSGRSSGADIVASTADFSNTGFVNSHYLAAGSDVFAATGYILGATPTGGYHQLVGVDNNQGTGSNGPCVTCHMGLDTADHSWNVVSKDETGAITAINSNACINCHPALTPSHLETAKSDVDTALAQLSTALTNVGVYYAPSYPYFFTSQAAADAADRTAGLKNWDGIVLGDGVTTGVGKDVMGAAYNYNLIAHDPGAYAHNVTYALQLLADSVDFLADGIVDGSGVFGVDDLLAPLSSNLDARGALHPGGGGAAIVDGSSTNTCAVCHEDIQFSWTQSAKANENFSPSSGLRKYDTEAKSQADADAGDAVRVCQQCHAPNWEAPAEADLTAAAIPGAIGCAGCHVSGAAVNDSIATCGSCHDGTKFHSSHGGDEKALVVASKHADGSYPTFRTTLESERCQMCHSTEGFLAFAEAGVGDANRNHELDGIGMVEVLQDTTCATCHDPHNGGLRTVAGWDPNGNSTADQFDLCTACHTYYNQDGVLTGSGIDGTAPFYHDTAWYRTISSTHYDDPATGYGLAELKVEGYVIRTNSENPCFDCHGHELRTNTRFATTAAPVDDPNNPDYGPTIHTDWAMSGHAGGLLNAKLAASDGSKTTTENAAVKAAGVTDDTGPAWNHYDWDAGNRQSCQKCHTSTGFANHMADPDNYSAANNDFSHLSGWANNGGTITPSGQNELLYCWGCHSDVETGDLRFSGALTLDYTVDGANPVIPDQGVSSICIDCHSGRGNMDSLIGAAAADPAGAAVAGGTKTHYMVAGAVINQSLTRVGYEYAGLSYDDKVYFAHDNIGCADCHMSTPGRSHTYDVVAKDGAGEITAITATNCVTCHDGEHALFVGASQVGTLQLIWDGSAAVATTVTQQMADDAAAELNHEAHGYHQALDALAAALTAAGTTPTSSYPYFSGSATDQGHGGAMHNYSMLHHEAGAYAHNRYYAKRLIFDSIDWLDNKVLDGTITIDADTYPQAAEWFGATAPATGSFVASRP